MNINQHLLQRAQFLSASCRDLQSSSLCFHSPGRIDSVLWTQLQMIIAKADRLQVVLYRKRTLERSGIRNLTPPFVYAPTPMGSFAPQRLQSL